MFSEVVLRRFKGDGIPLKYCHELIPKVVLLQNLYKRCR